MSKVVMIGIEGRDPVIVQKNLDRLPTLKGLQEQGIWGSLAGSATLNFTQSWLSVQSGLNPGVHGVWDGSIHESAGYKWTRRVDASVSAQILQLWNLPPKKVQRVGIVNLSFSCPAPQIPAGFALSGGSCTDRKAQKGWPAGFEEELRTRVGDHLYDLDLPNLDPEQVASGEVPNKIKQIDGRHLEILRYLYEQKDCDYLVGALFGLSRLYSSMYRGFAAQGQALPAPVEA